MGKTSDEITRKARNKMRQVWTHIWVPATSASLNLYKI
jgi:hypothetical protein